MTVYKNCMDERFVFISKNLKKYLEYPPVSGCLCDMEMLNAKIMNQAAY